MDSENDTFLTSLNRPKQVDSTIPQAEVINNLYSDLTSTVMSLDKQVGGVLRKHQIQFLNQYKQAMFKLQQEMKILKQKANDQQSKRRKAEKIQQLEKERNKLRQEAERLDKLCTSYKTSLQKWKAKAQELEDDHKFLENQVQAANSQNSVLQQQLQDLETEQEKVADLPVEEQELEHFQQQPQLQHKQYFNQLQSRFKNTIFHLQSQLEAERKTLRNLRSNKANYILEKGPLEDIFMQCVEEVKRDILARKLRTARLTKRSTSPYRKAQVKEDTEIKLKDFKDIDRRKVMELFLNAEQVRKFLYNILFEPEDT